MLKNKSGTFKLNPYNCADEIVCNLPFLNIGMVCK